MGISLKNVYYTYQEGSPFEGQALSDISLEIKDGSYTAIIGHKKSVWFFNFQKVSYLRKLF